MDLTPSHSDPGTPGDEPFGEPSGGQTAGSAADADSTATTPAIAGGPATAATGAAAARAADPRPHLDAEPLQLDGTTASRSAKEIGGKKFRVGAEDAYVPFRSRTKRRRRMIAAAAVGLVLVGAGTYAIGTLIGSPSRATGGGTCPVRADAAAEAAARMIAGQLPTAAQIKLNVYNSTDRHGLAATTAATLKQRGFTIDKVTNDPLKANLAVAAEIRGASANAAAMRVVAAEVIGSELRADARADGTVDLVLGTGFTALASPDQVSAALKHAQQTESQSTSPNAAGGCS